MDLRQVSCPEASYVLVTSAFVTRNVYRPIPITLAIFRDVDPHSFGSVDPVAEVIK